MKDNVEVSNLTIDYDDIITIVHDLQAPLSGVKWTLAMLLNGDAGPLTRAQIDLAKNAVRGNERTLRLVRSLLAVSRIDAGNNSLNRVEYPILTIINDVVDELSVFAREKQIKIQLRGTEGESPLLYIDNEKIRTVLENLVENALKYTQQGGTVTVGVRTENNECVVSVEDSGPGISKEDSGKLFQKFFRGSDKTKTATRGSGLGLYLAKRLIEAHGGRIWSADKKRDLGLADSGAVFAFMIPLSVGE